MKFYVKTLSPDLAEKSESRGDGQIELLLQIWTKILSGRGGRGREKGNIMKCGQYFSDSKAGTSSLQGKNAQHASE